MMMTTTTTTPAFIERVSLAVAKHHPLPHCLRPAPAKTSVRRTGSACRRLRVRATLAEDTSGRQDHPFTPPQTIDGYVTDEVDYDEDIVSDDTHVVIDSADVNQLIQQLQLSGQDDLTGNLYNADENSSNKSEGISQLKDASVDEQKGQEQEQQSVNTTTNNNTENGDEFQDPPEFDSEFFNAAERLSDAKHGRPSTVDVPVSNSTLSSLSSTLSSTDFTPFSAQSSTPSSTPTASTASITQTQAFFTSNPTASPMPSPSPSSHASTSSPSVPLNGASVRVEDLREREDSAAVSSNTDDVEYDRPMNYFSNENVDYMPSWVRVMYENNEHGKLEAGSRDLSNRDSMRRLHDIVERRNKGSSDSELMGNRNVGIADCTIRDVADDYNVPLEFVVDALIAFGVQTPIRVMNSIRDTCTSDEIQRLLNILTRNDSTVLAERYSDRSIAELADDYDLNPLSILAVCEKEGLYIHAGSDTHLSTIREDRVLEIMINDEPLGKPYPALLDGLE